MVLVVASLAGCKGSGSPAPSPSASPSAAAPDPAKVAAAASVALEAFQLANAPKEKRDPARSVTLYKKACDDGNADGCAGLGIELVWNQLGQKLDVAGGAAMLAAACRSGSMRGCNALGSATEEGKGVPKSEEQARELYQRACDGGERRGCRNVAVYLAAGRGGLPKSLDRSVALYDKACKMGDTFACAKFGMAMLEGIGVVRSCEKATELLEKACFDEVEPVGDACGNAYLSASQGRCDGRKDMKSAERYARRGCDVDKEQCFALASVYMGRGTVPADPQKVNELLHESCAHDSANGCNTLADAYAKGSWGVQRLPGEAARYRKKACDLGNDYACQRLRP